MPLKVRWLCSDATVVTPMDTNIVYCSTALGEMHSPEFSAVLQGVNGGRHSMIVAHAIASAVLAIDLHKYIRFKQYTVKNSLERRSLPARAMASLMVWHGN